MKNYILYFLAFSFLIACKPAVKMEPGVNVFGEDFKVENVGDFGNIIASLDSEKEIESVMKVQINSVCKVKGCWMTATPTNGGDGELFVKFKDYGFFVPVDMVDAGPKEVYMKGKAFKEITTVEELRHYAEDEGLPKEEIEKITEAEVQYKFMATGVKLI